MAKIIGKFLTFDDVLLVPRKSPLNSRSDVDLTTKLHPKIILKLPLISAAMDTVTEDKMAIAMARSGGIGIIHRFCSIEEQKRIIEKVKRVENWIIEKPLTVSPDTNLKTIYELVQKYGFWTFLVVNKKNQLVGMITKRDYIFEHNLKTPVKKLMVPFKDLKVSYKKLSLKEAIEFFKKYRVEKIPIINKNHRIIGLITSKDVENYFNRKATKDKKGRLMVGAALGLKDFKERAEELVKADVDLLVVDVAHGHLEKTLKVVKQIKKQFPDVPLMAGNIATPEGAKDLIKAGADMVKVGIGPGSACWTRQVTGVGVPQLGALMWIRKKLPKAILIADGGCKNSGDIVKALAAGANAVMLGNLLAGTDEAPGKIINFQNKKVKLFRGMASTLAFKDRLEKTKEDTDYIPVSEGTEFGLIPYKGSVYEILSSLEKGLRSGFSYCGASNLQKLWKNAEFVEISYGGIKESTFRTDIFN